MLEIDHRYVNDLTFHYSCPFDSVTIYDGPDNMAEKIGTYCGQMRNLVIFSTHNKLYITFTTLKRTAPAQNRGFFAIYEFSESFVKLGNVLFYFYLVFHSKKMLLRDGSYYEVCKIAGNENNSFPTLWKKIDFRKKWSKKLFGCATNMKEKVVSDIFLLYSK